MSEYFHATTIDVMFARTAVGYSFVRLLCKQYWQHQSKQTSKKQSNCYIIRHAFSPYSGNDEWELLGFPGEVVSTLYASGPDPYEVIHFTVQVNWSNTQNIELVLRLRNVSISSEIIIY